MTVKQFTTSETCLVITILKNLNGSYTAYENRTRENGGTIPTISSFSLDWLIDTLCMRYLPETLETVF